MFLHISFVRTMNGVFVERDTYRQANDSLNSIVLNQDNRFAKCQEAISSLEIQENYLQRMNKECEMLNIRCDDEVKKQTRLAKFWKHTAGIGGIVILGLAIAVIL